MREVNSGAAKREARDRTGIQCELNAMFSRVPLSKEASHHASPPVSRRSPSFSQRAVEVQHSAGEFSATEASLHPGSRAFEYSFARVRIFDTVENRRFGVAQRGAGACFPIQAKLMVGAVNDPLEQEADSIANHVMNIPGPGFHRHGVAGVQTTAAGRARTSGIDAPPIVGEVLGSPGRPLDPAARAFMEPRFGLDLSSIRLHTDAKAAQSARALGAEAYTSGSHIAFSDSAFPSGTQSSNRLLAHELAHTVQQTGLPSSVNDKANASLPPGHVASHPRLASRVALSPNRLQSMFVGMRLGETGEGDTVSVVREVGSFQGYDERLQAIAVARLHKLNRAAVVQDYRGKWHALEVSNEFYGSAFKAADTPTRQLYALPAFSSIAFEQKKERALQQHVYDVYGEKLGSEENKARADQDVERAKPSRASSILGVPPSEIQVNDVSGQKAEQRVNITTSPPSDAGSARTGPVKGAKTGAPGTKYAVEIDLDTLKDPEFAQANLFHEGSHLSDFELTQFWADKFRREVDSSFAPPSTEAFESWLNVQVSKRLLTKADFEIVIQNLQGQSRGTEARANLRSFLAALQAGQPQLAARLLENYATALRPTGGEYTAPAPESAVRQELISELRSAYQHMPETMKDQYDAAVAAALLTIKKYAVGQRLNGKPDPVAWIDELKAAR